MDSLRIKQNDSFSSASSSASPRWIFSTANLRNVRILIYRFFNVKTCFSRVARRRLLSEVSSTGDGGGGGRRRFFPCGRKNGSSLRSNSASTTKEGRRGGDRGGGGGEEEGFLRQVRRISLQRSQLFCFESCMKIEQEFLPLVTPKSKFLFWHVEFLPFYEGPPSPSLVFL